MSTNELLNTYLAQNINSYESVNHTDGHRDTHQDGMREYLHDDTHYDNHIDSNSWMRGR